MIYKGDIGTIANNTSQIYGKDEGGFAGVGESEKVVTVASFDIGAKNFCVCIESYNHIRLEKL